MAKKGLPVFCILFLLVSASLIFPSTQGTRTLQESTFGHVGVNIPGSGTHTGTISGPATTTRPSPGRRVPIPPPVAKP